MGSHSSYQQQIKVGFSGADGVVERLWATHVEGDLYRLDNAPAFAFGVSLHDVVQVHSDESGAAWAVRVARRGPVNTVRVVLDAQRPRSRRLMNMLAAIGCSSEGMNAVWFAVSAPDESSFERLVEGLATGSYRWEYVNPKREDVASPDATAAIERLVPPQIDGSQQALLHLHAPWKERADDELEVVVEIEPGRERSELLPARRIDEHRLYVLTGFKVYAQSIPAGPIAGDKTGGINLDVRGSTVQFLIDVNGGQERATATMALTSNSIHFSYSCNLLAAGGGQSAPSNRDYTATAAGLVLVETNSGVSNEWTFSKR